MQIALQIIAGLLYILAILQKKKWQMMLIYTLENAFLVAMYFSFNCTNAAVLNLVAMVRTFVLCVLAFKNIKPNIFVLIIFEVAYLTTSIIFFNNLYELIIIFGVTIACYTSWQNNTCILRTGYLINDSCNIAYKCIIGAYIGAIPDFVAFFAIVIAIVYYNILKKDKPILSSLQFKAHRHIQTEQKM